MAVKYNKKGVHNDEIFAAFGFLLPVVILYILFIFIPIVWTFYLSFVRYDIISPARFLGWKNWQRLFIDERIWLTLKNTAKFVFLLVPMQTSMGLLLALGVNSIKNRHCVNFFRTIYYFPVLVTCSSVILVWRFLLSTDLGIINYYLGLLGIGAIPWLGSSFWVYPSIMLFALWKFVGIYFLFFFIGLQNIDKGLIESAKIDGANDWQRFIHITIPMLSPTLFFVTITQLIGTIQIFDEPYILTKGGPGDASRSVSVYIYETAFLSQQYGYASSLSLVLLVIILAVTLIQMKGSSWVNYDRE
jgi:multiple sugar transport system permease protein